RQGERPRQLEAVREISEALAEEQGGRDGVERLRAHVPGIAGATDVPADADRQQRLVLRVLEEDVLERYLHVVEAGGRGLPVGIEDLVGAAQADAQIGRQALGELAAEGELARGRLLSGGATLEVRHGGQRQL